MKVLLIGEQHAHLLRVRRILEEQGWRVDVRDDMFAAGEPETYDVVVVQPSSQRPDELQSELAGIRRQVMDAILVVLGEFSVEERARALRMGADEFLQGGTPATLLLARLLALLRLRSSRFRPVYEIGDLVVNLVQRRVSRSGRDVMVSQSEFQLLVLLVQNAGQTVSRSQIMEQLWGRNVTAEDNSLDAHVSRVRRKIDGPFTDKLIVTVRGVGYQLADWSFAGGR